MAIHGSVGGMGWSLLPARAHGVEVHVSEQTVPGHSGNLGKILGGVEERTNRSQVSMAPGLAALQACTRLSVLGLDSASQ
jgi:hypothetical protein